MTTVLFIAALVVLVLCVYLVLARCYATGFVGSLGLGLVGLFTSIMLMDFDRYRLLPEVTMVYAGIALYLAQTATRAAYHALLARRGGRRTTDGRQLSDATFAPARTGRFNHWDQ